MPLDHATTLVGAAARSYNRAMASWRCPHCGAAQDETAVCWVCRRSTITCSSCRHFRRAIAGRLSYCGLDRARRPLSGDEERPCWVRAPSDAARSSIVASAAGPGSTATVEAPSLWALPAQLPDPADRSVRSGGMWADHDTHPAAIPPSIPHAGSDRPRPWGNPPKLAHVPHGFSEMPRRRKPFL